MIIRHHHGMFGLCELSLDWIVQSKGLMCLVEILVQSYRLDDCASHFVDTPRQIVDWIRLIFRYGPWCRQMNVRSID